MQPALSDYRWLTDSAAEPWLQQVAEDTGPLHALAGKLRRELSAERVHLVLEQVELRRRAVAKFERAPAMFFTRVGLEQATDQWIANYKAQRFARGARVADLCCGIGGDLLALAARGPAVGVDREEAAALLAESNCRALAVAGEQSGEVRAASAEAIDLTEFAAWHIDPDRRPHGRRTTKVELHEPSADALLQMLAQNPNAAIKLAPAAQLPADWPDAELEWISRDGECKQLVVWHGALATSPGRRRATIVDAEHEPSTIAGEPDLPVSTADTLGRFLFEPDAAVRAARLTGALAAEYSLHSTGKGSYLTGDQPIADRRIAAFQIESVQPFRVKPLKAHLREHGIGRLEIKTRGVSQDPDQLRKQLQVPGDQSATLIVLRTKDGLQAVLAQRM